MATEPEYISVNRHAYDRLADSYRARAGADRKNDEPVIAPFVDYLRARFATGARILDIGPGTGVNLAMFHERGFRVSGVDISQQMLLTAKELCPLADLRLGNFLTLRYAPASFEGIFSKASIHLFPKADGFRAIQKIERLLVQNGMLYVTTTVSAKAVERYAEKRDYPYGVVRYRKSWTRDELIAAVTDAGLQVYAESFTHEPAWNKNWFNLWAIKPTL